MTLTDAGFDLFQRLTQRTLLVIDCEYCRDPDGDGDRLISIAIVPVVRGRRERDGEFHAVMNPGVPVDPASSKIHGFTTADVARKRRFGYYAPAILAALNVDGAVLVQHTGSDLRVLRRELERLDEARTAGEKAPDVGLADLPELPVIDTSTLPRLLRLPDIRGRGFVSLETLCRLTGATNTAPHDARGDARATADALVKLLVFAASEARYAGLDELLADHDHGTTRAPRGGMYVRNRDRDPVLPPEHLVRHDSPLTHTGTDAERLAWLDRARECAELRCEHLRTEAALAAAENGPALLDPLTDLLSDLPEPGQAGTLLGAVAELLGPSDSAAKPAVDHVHALRWWAKRRPEVAASVPCGTKRAEMCPSCRADSGCPRDTLYQPIARIATYAGRSKLTVRDIKDRLWGTGNDPLRRIHRWRGPHPEVAAWMAWHVVTFESNRGRGGPATDRLMLAVDLGLHLVEPRLALLACEWKLATGEGETALAIAEQALSGRTTDTAYDDLHAWLAWQQQSARAAERDERPRIITHRKLARPEGRTNRNPYRIA